MSYTKGPWTFRPSVEDGTHSHWIDGPPDAPGATLGKPIAEVREYHKGESEANARLIAAAPELAEALAWILMDAKMLVDALNHPTLAPLTGRQIEGIAARIKAARTTYNKARGGA